LRGDARLLYFALLNLLDNALKYAHPATPIHIGIAAAPGGVAWHIRDHGPGIPEDRQHMIFDKYQRLDNGGDQPGLGMGLALARQIAERHGGRLDIDRAWTQGACFVLWLPA
jgi:signal transduction histidine kinase